jgi:thiosulfate dehydrogenase
MKPAAKLLIVLGAAGVLAAVFLAGEHLARPPQGVRIPARPAGPRFTPPPDSAIGHDPQGDIVALGRRIFTDTAKSAPQYVGNDLKCSNCHLDAGRRPNAAPLWAAYGMFPQYRKKNGRVNTFDERIRECFRYSMNGREPPAGDPVVVAIESYAAFLAKGAPIGTKLPGQGYLKLAPPAAGASYDRGKDVFVANCARCHGLDGQGHRADGEVIFPSLWGGRAYNWGAGMSDVPNAAGFIKSNMPQDRPGTLSDQQAWDVAAYIDGKPRPQDPRYTGSVAETARRYHDPARSAYGAVVDGVRLGDDGPPRRFRTGGSAR